MPNGRASLGQGQGSLVPAGLSLGKTWCSFSLWPCSIMTLWDKDLGKAVSEATRWCPRSSLLSFLSPACPHAPASFPGNPQTTDSLGVGSYSHAEHPQPWLSSTPGPCDSDTPQRSAPWPRCHQHLWRDGDRTGSPLLHLWCLEQSLHQIPTSWQRAAHVRDRRVAAETIIRLE